MRTHKKWRFRLLSVLLVLSMAVGIMPTAAFAAQETGTEATSKNVAIVQSYAAQMMNANKKSDYTAGKFSWDTEGKSDSWRYFNGVMLDAFMMVGDSEMTSYVDAVLSDNVDSNGTCAKYHVGEVDSVPMALAMFDLLDSSANAEKYKKAIQYVYTQLEGQVTYDSCGGNFLHKQDGNGNPTSGWTTWNIGLDGLYMAQPFLMECANAIDSGKLTLKDKSGSAVTSESIYAAVYNRFAWVAESMYDSTTGLYHHGWNVSKNTGNGHFWGRGIGWYAMALVDVIDMMPATYQTQMTPYLTKLFDGMLQYQDADTGMWYNVVNRRTDLDKNILETSVSSMMAYALMKAYNQGFVTDAKYGNAGLAAFNGVVANKVTGSESSYAVKDTYLKSGVGESDSYYTQNGYTVDEAKGTGALIMASTQANAAAAKLNNTTDPEPTVPESVTDTVTGVAVSGSGATAITVVDKSSDSTVAVALADKLESGFAAYDITLTGYTQGTAATVTMPAPEGADTVYYVAEDGVTEAITGVSFADGKATFTATHFSTYAAGKAATPSESGGAADSASASGTLPGGTNYVLVTNGTIESGAEYLIVNTASDGTGYALRNNDGSSAKQEVTISNNMATISSNESSCLWTFTESDGGYTIKNGTRYIRLNKDSWISTTSSTTTVTSKSNNVFWLNYDNYYLRYKDNSFERSDSGSKTYRRNVYLFKKTTTEGVSVTLTVTPGSASMKPADTADLNATVLVGDVAATSSVITWSSPNENVATVDSNGKVTAVADGTATITATLTSANGLTPTETVMVEIPITVTSKTITSAVLSGNDPVTTKKGVEPDFSNIKLTVTYDDNTTGEITTENGLVISGYKDEVGTYYAKISYQGTEYGEVKVTVDGNPYEGLEEATEYPEYPADGAVRIDKTATGQDFNSTGVVKVELDAAGISVKQGVDVVLVVDVSNSMAWSLENAAGDGTGDAVKLPSAGQSTKLDNAMDAADSFAKILLEDNTGADSDNSVSFVTFAGYDKDHYNTDSGKNDEKNYVDSVMTVFTNVTDYGKAAASFAGTSVTGVANGTGATYTLTVVDEKGTTLVNGGNRGNTNYDYAFYQAQQAVTELQGQYTNYANSGRTTYIVFMTDGAPSHYNRQNCNGGSGRDYWPDSTSSTYNLGYTTSNWTEYILNHDNTYANALYQMVGGNFYAFGFDLANGGFSDYQGNEQTLTQVLAGMVTDATIPVMATSDAAALNNFYETLAHQIKYAGTNAKVTDTIDSNFTLQTTSFGTGSQPASIDVTAYDLYTKAETSDNSLIGTRKGDSTVMETVTFNEDGTQAYSSVLGETTNIMTTDADGMVTIAAQYFTYTKDTSGVEKFVWNIGNITDKEVALSFYAYLKGSKEGTCAEGVYYTNEGATIEYVDINGKHASKDFPVPTVSWGSAITQIEYYLVNENGEPVNNAGDVIPFANRIEVGTTSVRTFNWNESLTVNGNGYVPAGYDMYNPDARYMVTAGSDGSGSLTIYDTKVIVGTEEITTKRVDTNASFADTTVAFGVLFKGEPQVKTPLGVDQIVMDYGKAIRVNVVTAYDTVENGFKIDSVVGFLQYDEAKDVTQTQFTSGTATFNGDYGQFTIVDGKVNYQPRKMLSAVEKIFVVVKVANESNTDDYYYMLNELDIIPATIMYYETDFADGVFTLNNSTDETTEAKYKWSMAGSVQTEVQDDGTIGVNQTYGFDSTYADDALYSNGSSFKVEGAKLDNGYTNASFSFTGTGFDIISRTGANQGLIQVKIFASGASEPTKKVSVLNKSESNLELYQIPVVSVNDLPYGTYDVTIDVYPAVNSYSGALASLNRGGEFHFDALRIYDPINVSAGTSDASIAQTAYVADGEANNAIIEVRQKIIEKQTFDDESGVVNNAVVFVDRTPAGVGVADYTTIGPNNEVYLSKGQGIAFKLTSTETPASIDIGVKSADGNAVTLNASLYSMDDQYNAFISVDITSSTALFYDLMAEAECTTSAILSGGGAYVCIFNDGDGILSITDLKVAYGNQPGTATFSVDKGAVWAANKALTEEKTDEPNYDILSASFDTATCKLRKKATMTVVTTDDVRSLQVTNKKGKQVKADITSTTENGLTTWTVSIQMTVGGKQTYTVTGYAANGTSGASTNATINVTRK